MDWYLMVWKKYAVFEGRSRRKEYWMFYLINAIICALLSFLSYKISFFGLVSGVYNLALIVPGIALTTRRLHDIGKSGWWQLIAFVPIIGIIWLLILVASAGQTGANAYGNDPKAGSPIA